MNPKKTRARIKIKNLPSGKKIKSAKEKYEDKTYKKYMIRLRKDIDAELIDFIANNKEIGTTELIRRGLLELYKDAE